MFKKEKLESELARLAAKFLKEYKKGILVTVTSIKLSDNLKSAIIFFTILPEQFENEALTYFEKNKKEFNKFLKEKSRIGTLPEINFKIDLGEKNRQNIDKLVLKTKN